VTPGPDALRKILKQCGISLDPEKLEALWRYHELLRAANPRLNLTRIHNFESMVLKHYVDSLLVLDHFELPSPLVDMGSGAGLPGIPLKIARPAIRMILAEPRAARAAFLRDVVARLDLKDVEVYAHRVGPDYPGQVAGVISRALGAVGETLDRVAACLPRGGRMIFMKGPGCDDEIAQAAATHHGIFRLTADHSYVIKGTSHERRLVVYERLEVDAPQRSRRPGPAASFTGPMRELSSAANPTFRRLRDLLSGPGIRKHGEAILAGMRICAETLARFRENVLGWITDTRAPEPPDASITWFRLTSELFKELDVAGTHAPLLLLRVPEMAEWTDDEPWPDGCTLFVPFQDPENVGTVIRSAAAFGAARVVLLREAAHPFHPRSSRAAGPALFQVPLLHGPSLKELRVKNAPLIALDLTGTELSAFSVPDRFGLAVGLEGPGLPPHLRPAQRVRIAMQPGVESLNAATAAAIALYAWSSKLKEVISCHL
jgi:16S rRNA (guanine527-N7)-methyltransferase